MFKKQSSNVYNLHGKWLGTAAITVLGFTNSPVFAQENIISNQVDSSALEEIVVTVNRVQERLQDVGITASAFTGDTVRARGIIDSGDLGTVTSGLIIAKAGGSELTGLVSIRGVSQNDFTAHLESPNAFYLDEVYQPSASNSIQQFYDVERIEVLKGPQGTLFGRNATGGLLNVFTRDPGNEIEGYLTAGVASYNQISLQGGLTVPINDKLTTRVAFLRTRHDGFYENVAPGGFDLNGDNTSAVRLKINYTPTEKLSIQFAGDYYHTDYKGTGGNFTVPAGQDPLTGLGFNLPRDTPFALGGGRALRPFQTTADFPGGYSRETYGISARVNYYFDSDIILSSITSYAKVKSDYREDNDQTFASVGTFEQRPDNTNISQELRLHKDTGRFRWNVGAYYLNVTGDYFNRFNFIAADADLSVNYNIDAQSYSAFAQVAYDISENLTLTAGARIVHDEKQYLQIFNCLAANPGASACPAFGGPGTIGDASPLRNNHNETGWTGRLQLDYKATEDLLLYASLNRGYKSFNYNANFAGNVPLSGLILDGEVLFAKEVGLKYAFLDGRAKLNMSAFHYDYKDYHAFDQRSLNFTLFNADAEIYGAEVDLTVKPVSSLLLNLAVNFLDSKVFNVPIQGLGLVTRQATQSPRYSIVASIEQNIKTNIGDFTAIANGVYYDDAFAQISNAPNTFLQAYGVVNARLNFTPMSPENIQFSVYATNLLNDQSNNYAFDLSVAGYTELNIINPRIIGFDVTVKF